MLFDGTGSCNYDSWTLTFGDNTPNDGPNEGDVPAAIPHTYSQPGTYTATLQVCQSLSDSGVGSGSAKQYETCDSASVTIDVLGPNVLLTPPFSTGVAPLTVSFTGQDLNAPPECTIGSWTLDFGDGSSASGSGPPVAATHTYPAHGNYIPHLTMTDCLGTGSGFALVKVDPAPPTAVLDVLGGSGLQVTFSGANSHDPDDAIASWSMAFGDGVIVGSTGAPGVVSHTFPGPGTYTVTLTVTDTTNLSDSTSRDVTVPFPVQAAVIPPVTPPISPPPIIPPPIALPPFVPPVLLRPPTFTPPIVLPQPVIPSPVIPPPPPVIPPLLVPPAPVTPSPAPAPVEVALELLLDQPSVAPGGEVTARGQGCPGNVPVTLLLGDKVVGTTTSNPDGRFQAPVSTNDIPVGDYQLVAHCGDRTVTTQLAVVLAQSTPPSGSSLLVVFLFMLAAVALLRRQLFGA